MSFDALPTELDNHILLYLDHDGLNAMSQTSKTYRTITEPFLYRNLELKAGNHVSIRWLVITLLCRPEVAAYIKRIEIAEDGPTNQDNKVVLWSGELGPTQRQSAVLEQHLSRLHEIMINALGPDSDMAGLRITWIGAVLADDHVEGSLALIVCLAVHLESLVLGDEMRRGVVTGYHGERLTSVMWAVFTRSCKRYGPGKTIVSPDACAFPNLYHIHLTTRSSVRIMALPNLLTLRIEGCDELRISHNFSMCASLRLESLEIVDTLGSVYEIRELFENNHARDLKKLIFRNFSTLRDSFQPIVDTLLTNCLCLEYFELSAHEDLSDPDPEPLKGLSGLNSLKELRIDVDFLVSVEDRMHMGFLSLDKLLPPNLEKLHATGVCAFEFCDFVERRIVPLYHTQSGLARMCEFASSCSPKMAIVTVGSRMNFKDEWREIAPVLVHIASVLWAEVKFSFSVYGSVWGNETEDKLLIDHEGGSDISVFFHDSEGELSESEFSESG